MKSRGLTSVGQRRGRGRRCHRDSCVEDRVARRRVAARAQQGHGLALRVRAAVLMIGGAALAGPSASTAYARALHWPVQTNRHGQSFLSSAFLLLSHEKAATPGNKRNTNRT